MGANMVRRLQKNGHQCVVYDRSPESVKQLSSEGATGSNSLDEFVKETKQAARYLADGACRRRRRHSCMTCTQARKRRHPYRRRKFLLH